MAVTHMRRMSARARWAVPVGVVAAAGVVIAASAVASAAEPALPAQTVAHLLAEAQRASARPPSPMTATVQETADLGLPTLPQVGQPGQPGQSSLLSGTTTVNIWYLDPQHVRVAEPQPMGESDVRLDGTQLWLWDSQSQTATHVLLPAGLRGPGTGTSGPPSPSSAYSSRLTIEPSAPNISRLLAAASASTTIALGPNATVAGRAAYQISITPKGSGSLVGQILIAIDASRYIPLRVEVFARGSSSPAFALGYTALSFGAPAMSNFSFTPPHGAKVQTIKVPASPGAIVPGLGGPSGLGGLGPSSVFSQAGIGGFSTLGQSAATKIIVQASLGSAGVGPTASPVGSSATAVESGATPPGPGVPVVVTAPPGTTGPPPGMLKALRKRLLAHLPPGMTAKQRAAAVKALDRALSRSNVPPPSVPGFSFEPGIGKPQVLGSGWTTVVATPASPAVASAVAGLLSSQPGPIKTGPASLGPDLAVIQALLRASTAVHGSWGSGRLLRSALLTVLVTSKGQVLAGAVTPGVLYADAAALSR
jgi:outer membrane lipoprotein-sorting protein